MAIATGVGTILSRGQTTPPNASPAADSYVAVGRVKSITGPQVQKEQVEVTTLDSTGGFKEFLSGIKDPGQATFDIVFDPANNQHLGIRADSLALSAAAMRNWKIVWTNGETVYFQGEVLGYNRSTEPNTPLTASITVQISGLPTYV